MTGWIIKIKGDGDMKLGFIGAGNMGGAIIEGIVKAGIYSASDIVASDLNGDLLHSFVQRLGIGVAQNNRELAEECDVIFLCVKPIYIRDVVVDIGEIVMDEKLIVSVMAGKPLAQLHKDFDNLSLKFIRAMPNTPALIGRGMTAICHLHNIEKSKIDMVCKIFESIGEVKVMNESYFDAFIGVAGSSPAYAFMFIEAMADAGVMHGLTRTDAIKFAANAVAGAAQMVVETGIHPAVLRDNVASPGGTTIVAIAELEAQGFRNAIIKAVDACVKKSVVMNNFDN